MTSAYRIVKWPQVYAPNPAELRHLLTVEGYFVHQWRDPPGTEYTSHFHPEDQSHWVISGTLEISVKEVGVFLLEAGDRDFLPGGIYHEARVIGDEHVLYLVGAKR